MKRIILPVFLLLMLSSTGCTSFLGWDLEGHHDPHPLPPDIEEWTKSNTDAAQRKEDWISCGGNSAGYIKISPVTPTGGLTGEDHIRADKEYDAAQACMMKKGYKFIGSCRGPLSGRLSCKGKSIFNL